MWGPTKGDIIGFICVLLLMGAGAGAIFVMACGWLSRHLSITWN